MDNVTASQPPTTLPSIEPVVGTTFAVNTTSNFTDSNNISDEEFLDGTSLHQGTVYLYLYSPN